jgi:hypothetical protein
MALATTIRDGILQSPAVLYAHSPRRGNDAPERGQGAEET